MVYPQPSPVAEHIMADDSQSHTTQNTGPLIGHSGIHGQHDQGNGNGNRNRNEGLGNYQSGK